MNIRCYLRFEPPPLSDFAHLAVPDRAQWLKSLFQERLDALAPWLQGITLLNRFDYLLSATVEGSPEVCGRLRSYLESSGNGSLTPADTSVRQVENVPAAQAFP